MRCMEGMQAFACTLLDLLVLVDMREANILSTY